MDSTRLLAFGGIAFVVCALLAGELYAIYVSHVANGVIGRTWPENSAGPWSGAMSQRFPSTSR